MEVSGSFCVPIEPAPPSDDTNPPPNTQPPVSPPTNGGNTTIGGTTPPTTPPVAGYNKNMVILAVAGALIGFTALAKWRKWI